jgi:uncharacterized Tic20 family protein
VAGLRLAANTPLLNQVVPFLLLMNLLVAFNWLAFALVGAHRAATGQGFTYPLTLPFRGRS